MNKLFVLIAFAFTANALAENPGAEQAAATNTSSIETWQSFDDGIASLREVKQMNKVSVDIQEKINRELEQSITDEMGYVGFLNNQDSQ